MNYSQRNNMEDLAQKDPVTIIDELLETEEIEFTKRCLLKLGLTERKGIDGQNMLYPIKAKERILEKNELNDMIKRLYVVKKHDEEDDNLHGSPTQKFRNSKNLNHDSSVYSSISKQKSRASLSRHSQL